VSNNIREIKELRIEKRSGYHEEAITKRKIEVALRKDVKDKSPTCSGKGWGK